LGLFLDSAELIVRRRSGDPSAPSALAFQDARIMERLAAGLMEMTCLVDELNAGFLKGAPYDLWLASAHLHRPARIFDNHPRQPTPSSFDCNSRSD
jgi:hypothetical protein